jgi:hypothetical protein
MASYFKDLVKEAISDGTPDVLKGTLRFLEKEYEILALRYEKMERELKETIGEALDKQSEPK